MKELAFSELPSSFFFNVDAGSFHKDSKVCLEDENDLENPMLRVRITSFVPQANLPCEVVIGKVTKTLSLSLALSKSKINFASGAAGNWTINSWHESTFQVGDIHVANGVRVVLESQSEVSIGNGCMFSDNVLLQCGSQHSIICLNSRSLVNAYKSSISIGRHCWIGRDSTVVSSSRDLKIGFGSIVGIGSIVTRSVPSASLVVGSPAKIVRSNVTWSPSFRASSSEIDDICDMF